MKTNFFNAALFGAAIGDALGVPVEFTSRVFLSQNPVDDFRGYGVWHQPPGTFSDDSSLLFCTAESLCNGYDLNDIAARFVQWMTKGYWGAHNVIFDIGGVTRDAIQRLQRGISPTLSGGERETDNGNSSLMRILPMAFYLCTEQSADVRFETVSAVSGITHGHFRSAMACFIYVEVAIALINGADWNGAYKRMQQTVKQLAASRGFSKTEMKLFRRILTKNISIVAEDDIRSSGYVLHTLEAALWCVANTTSYTDCVLLAVNLGDDTDTTACVAGGLAGLRYGFEAIPARWVQGLVRSADVADLAKRLFATNLA